jgi:uncharacterized protein YecE (DUF72 family)
MAHVYVGTSGWAYAEWKPQFYPPKLPQKQFLKHYSSRLNAVEVNYSFRRFVPEKTLQNWIAETPDGFQFSLKAHQAITHFRRLKNVAEPLDWFLRSVNPLAGAGKLGPVLFQLPPQFKADVAVLSEFLAALPRTMRFAFEFRHPSWFSDPVFAALEQRNAALCVAESDERVTPEVRTANFYYYRLRKPDYTAGDRRKLAERIAARAGDKLPVFVFFKHEDRPESPLYAEQLFQAVLAKAA